MATLVFELPEDVSVEEARLELVIGL